MGRKAGLTDAKLSAVLGDDLSSFTEPERLAIELSDALTSTPANVSDDLYTKLRSQFSEEQLLELSAQISFRTGYPASIDLQAGERPVCPQVFVPRFYALR